MTLHPPCSNQQNILFTLMKRHLSIIALILSAFLFNGICVPSALVQSSKQHTTTTQPTGKKEGKKKDDKKKDKQKPQRTKKDNRSSNISNFFLHEAEQAANSSQLNNGLNAQQRKPDTLTVNQEKDTAIITLNISYSPEGDTINPQNGVVEIMLYPDANLQRVDDIFAYFIGRKEYDGMRFHRIIKDFMVQVGDPNSKRAATLSAEEREYLGAGSLETGIDTISATPFVPRQLFQKTPRFHKYGAVAIAREGDDSKPKRSGSTSQFYIVTDSARYDNTQLLKYCASRRLKYQGDYRDRFYTNATPDKFFDIKLPEEVVKTYGTIGGAPYLDEDYVVIGEVIKGMDIVQAIQNLKTNESDYPEPGYAIITSATIDGYTIKNTDLKQQPKPKKP